MQDMNFFKMFMVDFLLTFTGCFTDIPLSDACTPLYTAMFNIKKFSVIATQVLYP